MSGGCHSWVDLTLTCCRRNESFAFAAAPATQPKLFVWVYDHKTLGKDKLLGSADIDVRLRHAYPHLHALTTVYLADLAASATRRGCPLPRPHRRAARRPRAAAAPARVRPRYPAQQQGLALLPALDIRRARPAHLPLPLLPEPAARCGPRRLGHWPGPEDTRTLAAAYVTVHNTNTNRDRAQPLRTTTLRY